MKKFFLPILMIATVSLAQFANAGPGSDGSAGGGETASTVSGNSSANAPNSASGQTTESFKEQAGLNEARKLESSENGQNQASLVGPYDFGAKNKLEAAADGELCVSGKCYAERAHADYCKATFANCPLPAGSALAPKTPAAPAGTQQ